MELNIFGTERVLWRCVLLTFFVDSWVHLNIMLVVTPLIMWETINLL